MSTTAYCPRCGLPMTVASPHVREVTCPSCLARVPVNRPVPVLPLEYAAPRGDVDAELRKDQTAAFVGIVVFALVAACTLLWLKSSSHVKVPNLYIYGAVGVLTAIAALRVLAKQAEKRHAARMGVPVHASSPGERAASIVFAGMLGFATAILAVVVAAIALFVIVFIACFGGLKGL